MFYQTIKPFIKSISKQQFKRNEIIYHEGDNPENYAILAGSINAILIPS